MGAMAVTLGCVTESVQPAKRGTVGPVKAGGNVRTDDQGSVAAPVTQQARDAKSNTSAARVMLQPLGLVTYDGLTLPLVSPDGGWLAAQSGEAPSWSAVIGAADAEVPKSVLMVFDLDKLPLTGRVIEAPAGGGMMLEPLVSADGFLISVFDARGERFPAMVGFGADEWREVAWPEADEAVEAKLRSIESAEARYLVMSSMSRVPASMEERGIGPYLYFDQARGCMVIADESMRTSVVLEAGSIAGCWAEVNGEPGVLLTKADGLYRQSLVKSERGWSAGSATRLMREPWVVRATTSAARPYILIGPGPKDQPERLQVMSMQLLAPDSAAAP